MQMILERCQIHLNSRLLSFISADEAWSESAWQEAVWFDDEANLLRTLCRRRRPRTDQTHHREDAEVRLDIFEEQARSPERI